MFTLIIIWIVLGNLLSAGMRAMYANFDAVVVVLLIIAGIGYLIAWLFKKAKGVAILIATIATAVLAALFVLSSYVNFVCWFIGFIIAFSSQTLIWIFYKIPTLKQKDADGDFKLNGIKRFFFWFL